MSKPRRQREVRHLLRPGWYHACWVVILLLEWIPRYGRVQTMIPGTAFEFKDFETGVIVRGGGLRTKWKWQFPGHWGSTLLGRIGILYDFVNEGIIREGIEASLTRQERRRRDERRERRSTLILVVMALLNIGCIVWGFLA